MNLLERARDDTQVFAGPAKRQGLREFYVPQHCLRGYTASAETSNFSTEDNIAAEDEEIVFSLKNGYLESCWTKMHDGDDREQFSASKL